MFRIIAGATLALLGAIAQAAAQGEAQDYPNRAVRIIVPFPPGAPAALPAPLPPQHTRRA